MEHPVLISERSGAVALLHAEEAGWRRRELLSNGRWPTWNPVRDVIAVSVVEPRGDHVESTIELIGLDGEKVRTLHRGATGIAPLIAPRIPHYAVWSPRGDVLSYVAQSSYGLTLFLSHVEGYFTSDPIINGGPLFISWCPDSNFLGVHAGEELAVVETEGSRTTANVAQRAVGFRSPAFSGDANIMAYALPVEPGVAIMRAHFQGTSSREVHRFAGGVALGFRPRTEQLTAAVTRQPDTGAFNELWSLDLAQDPPAVARIAGGPFVACWWAPAGDRIALIVPSQTGDGRYAARVLDPQGRVLAASEAILPSQDYRLVLGFFDQFAQSHSLWSPDGRHFLLAGRLAGDAVSASFGDPVGDYVIRWPVERGAALELLAPGEIGFYRPLSTNVP